MSPEKRKPPGWGRLSGVSVGVDTSRNNRSGLKKQSGPFDLADLRFRRQVERVYRLGPRVVGERLADIAAERGFRTVIDLKLDRYSRLDPKAVEVVGADKFWPAPVHEVQP